jgi:hypothetical protein
VDWYGVNDVISDLLFKVFSLEPEKRCSALEISNILSNKSLFPSESSTSPDLSLNIPSLQAFVQSRITSYSLMVSSGIINFHKAGRYEQEKILAIFSTEQNKQKTKFRF